MGQRFKSVEHTPELDRILAIPRRVLRREDGERLVEVWNPLLSRHPQAALRPWQALALDEGLAARQRGHGAVYALPVGLGKTLLLWLMAYVLDADRPVMCLPAGLKRKTLREFGELSRIWQCPKPPPKLITYGELARDDTASLLERENCDCLLLEEAHNLRNTDGGAVRHLAWYKGGAGEDVPTFAFTGTLSRKSVLNYAHILIWCLGEDCPVPRDPDEVELWGQALDLQVNGMRAGVGALRALGPHHERETLLQAARRNYRDRLQQTPGLMIVDEDSCDLPITVTLIPAPPDPKLDALFTTLRTTGEIPGGEIITDPLSMHRIDGELGTGLVQYWDPPAPKPWRDAYRAYADCIKGAIRETATWDKPCFTEGSVKKRFPQLEEIQAWKEIEPTFKPKSVARWCSGSVVMAAKELEAKLRPVLIWCENPAFAEALSTATGLDYFGRKGENARGQLIDDQPKDRSAILSINGCREGRNLQGWHKNLFINPPQSALEIEQLIGRTHRSLQEKSVEVWILITSGLTLYAFDCALAEAAGVAEREGLTQKLLRATINDASVMHLGPDVSHRWARKYTFFEE